MDQGRSRGLRFAVSSEVDQAIARACAECGVDIVNKDGKLGLDRAGLSLPKWPKKLDPARCVVIDTSEARDGFSWPTPRFEILIANLDAIGLTAVQIGSPASEKLQRAQQHFARLEPAERAAVIDHTLLWIGHDTCWRYAAAALGKPQVIIASQKIIGPVWPNTFQADSSRGKAESTALGPVSVTAVATAVRDALKKLGVPEQ